ncbi:hypothetical protein P280DRAFT_207966 [Massarina eburnea CBS 473.64]|uniref:Uncharacterized protein n=1 Tax=Massarina eburnea CBS 473.64 TaxID=1395130 RepID=A0A6A6RK66_9PLEO|nr:hypothetical protein P280DRAFT_207966 [Massarina eburnea CBS 473.64]
MDNILDIRMSAVAAYTGQRCQTCLFSFLSDKTGRKKMEPREGPLLTYSLTLSLRSESTPTLLFLTLLSLSPTLVSAFSIPYPLSLFLNSSLYFRTPTTHLRITIITAVGRTPCFKYSNVE